MCFKLMELSNINKGEVIVLGEEGLCDIDN